ncbi:O-acetylhomoserine aminocarboxypropyltransferase/cysteine synthase family protein [Basfia succiniciproducens]|uniref:O-acetylhomoserine aminocarboxypropyltransferase/cysteine synthase family protein n=1 Tax=Basfia succiniciproducens TaxID=653940 RepID=UPI0008C9D593|nr:aminotransferase class I/II-fold pyridoxal phosphate-dependent enzyme [Basfia succiniciproducens]SEQ51437.1 O-acetylhomoserine (thiol)-lyase [Basfia succiniciproducens]
MKFETQCLHAGYSPKNGEPRVQPIVQSTTYTYDSAESIGKLFDLQEAGFFYTRLANPTTNAAEEKLAALEGGVAALCTASGQAATFYALMNLVESGDHFISTTNIYGGTYNLFAHTFRKMGVEVTFVNQDDNLDELRKAIRPNTKAVFGETISNPTLRVLDIEKFAALAQAANAPLIIDNTFATPYFCRPFEYGANIVVHSTSKYLDGHAVALGGAIIDGGNFNWEQEKFRQFSQPDITYHGLVYTRTFGKAAYAVKARVQLMRDLGATPAPQNSFLLNLGMETLPLRMKQHYANAQAVAEWLERHPMVERVDYPGLASSKDYELKQKYTPNGLCGVLSFELKGDKQTAMKWLDSLQIISREVHVADIRSCALHPATSTHRQLSDEEMRAANITPGFIRLSIGIENPEDLLADLQNAFDQIK